MVPSCISHVITNIDGLAWDGAEKPAGQVRSRGPEEALSPVVGELGRCTDIIGMNQSVGRAEGQGG